MTRLMYFSLLCVLGCTFASPKQETKSIRMHELWKNSATQEHFIRALGKSSEARDRSLVYHHAPAQSGVDSAHFFNPKGQIEEQFIFVSGIDLQKLLSHVPCQWDKKSALKSLGHAVGNVETGSCANYGITYVFDNSMHLHEVRWKR